MNTSTTTTPSRVAVFLIAGSREEMEAQEDLVTGWREGADYFTSKGFQNQGVVQVQSTDEIKTALRAALSSVAVTGSDSPVPVELLLCWGCHGVVKAESPDHLSILIDGKAAIRTDWLVKCVRKVLREHNTSRSENFQSPFVISSFVFLIDSCYGGRGAEQLIQASSGLGKGVDVFAHASSLGSERSFGGFMAEVIRELEEDNRWRSSSLPSLSVCREVLARTVQMLDQTTCSFGNGPSYIVDQEKYRTQMFTSLGQRVHAVEDFWLPQGPHPSSAALVAAHKPPEGSLFEASTYKLCRWNMRSSKVFWLVGSTAMGKTTWCLELLRRPPFPDRIPKVRMAMERTLTVLGQSATSPFTVPVVSAYHFCVASDPTSIHPAGFAQSIMGQLCDKGFVSAGVARAAFASLCTPGVSYAKLLRRFFVAATGNGNTLVILVDGLDWSVPCAELMAELISVTASVNVRFVLSASPLLIASRELHSCKEEDEHVLGHTTDWFGTIRPDWLRSADLVRRVSDLARRDLPLGRSVLSKVENEDDLRIALSSDVEIRDLFTQYNTNVKALWTLHRVKAVLPVLHVLAASQDPIPGDLLMEAAHHLGFDKEDDELWRDAMATVLGPLLVDYPEGSVGGKWESTGPTAEEYPRVGLAHASIGRWLEESGFYDCHNLERVKTDPILGHWALAKACLDLWSSSEYGTVHVFDHIQALQGLHGEFEDLRGRFQSSVLVQGEWCVRAAFFGVSAEPKPSCIERSQKGATARYLASCDPHFGSYLKDVLAHGSAKPGLLNEAALKHLVSSRSDAAVELVTRARGWLLLGKPSAAERNLVAAVRLCNKALLHLKQVEETEGAESCMSRADDLNLAVIRRNDLQELSDTARTWLTLCRSRVLDALQILGDHWKEDAITHVNMFMSFADFLESHNYGDLAAFTAGSVKSLCRLSSSYHEGKALELWSDDDKSAAALRHAKLAVWCSNRAEHPREVTRCLLGTWMEMAFEASKEWMQGSSDGIWTPVVEKAFDEVLEDPKSLKTVLETTLTTTDLSKDAFVILTDGVRWCEGYAAATLEEKAEKAFENKQYAASAGFYRRAFRFYNSIDWGHDALDCLQGMMAASDAQTTLIERSSVNARVPSTLRPIKKP